MNENNNKLFLIVALIFTVALTRLMPHPWNFTPVTALFIFAGAFSGKRYLNFLIPLSAVLLSDFLLNYFVYHTAGFSFFYPGAFMVYFAYLAIYLFNAAFKANSNLKIAGSSLISSVIFFLLTNFGSWFSSPIYTKDFAGLMTSYAAGLPFFGNALLGDLFYTFILFSVYGMIYRSFLKKSEVYRNH